MKTSELIGPALDWAVCLAEGNKPVLNPIRFGGVSYGAVESELGYAIKNYQHDWAQGGPIIERENIALRESKGKWYAITSSDLGDGEGARWILYTFKTVPKTASKSRQCRFSGPTPLIAAMRCYVASKLGDEVKIPEELK